MHEVLRPATHGPTGDTCAMTLSIGSFVHINADSVVASQLEQSSTHAENVGTDEHPSKSASVFATFSIEIVR